MISEARFIEILRSEVNKAGSQKALALRVGVSQQFMGYVLDGRRGPGDKIPAALGYEKRIRYRKVRGG